VLPTGIVIHCSASGYGSVDLVDEWHRQRDFARLATHIRDGEPKHIGYHYLIPNGLLTASSKYEPHEDGKVYPGRHENENGAHAFGVNQSTLGVCLVGKGRYTSKQLASAHCLVASLCFRYGIPASFVIGHRETPHEKSLGPSAKTCPELEMNSFREEVQRILAVMEFV
jgi:N-acetyl-anhydromuramyl-L-alanine amidase AmpD